MIQDKWIESYVGFSWTKTSYCENDLLRDQSGIDPNANVNYYTILNPINEYFHKYKSVRQLNGIRFPYFPAFTSGKLKTPPFVYKPIKYIYIFVEKSTCTHKHRHRTQERRQNHTNVCDSFLLTEQINIKLNFRINLVSC